VNQVYGAGSFDLGRGYVYVAAINNLTQLWALYDMII